MRAVKLTIRWVLLSSALSIAALGQATSTRAIGTVTAVSGNNITIKTDAGVETSISVPESARILRTQPGQRDLATATPIEVKDIQVGDRILVQGTQNGGQVEASRVIVMARSDIAQKQQQDENGKKQANKNRVTDAAN